MNEYRMIDGNDIEKFILSFILFIKKILHYILGALKKHFIVAVIVFAGIVTFYEYKAYKAPKYYLSTTAFTFHYFNFKVYGQLSENMNRLAATHSYKNLAAVLQLSEQQASSIISIEGKDANGKPLITNTSLSSGPIYFQVKTTDNRVFMPLEAGLKNYLNNAIPLQRELQNSDIKATNKKLQYIENNIKIVDSILRAWPENLKAANIWNDTDTHTAHIVAMLNYKDQLEDKRLEREQFLNSIDTPVKVLYSFPVPENTTCEGIGKPLWVLLVQAFMVSTTVAVLLRMFLK